MGKIIREIDRGTRVVAGVDVRITELVWDNGGRSFDVHRTDNDAPLTEDESFDEPPTDQQITVRLEHQEPIEPWVCPGCCAQLDASQADLIVDHVLIFCDLVDGTGNPRRQTP